MRKNPLHIIKRPHVTEKTTFNANEQNRHTFDVDLTATKDEIKAAIEELYQVKVVGISTVRRKERRRRYRYGYVAGKTEKKAIVKLREGDAIDLF